MTLPLAFFENFFSDNLATPTPVEVIIAVVVSLILNLMVATIYKNTYRGKRYSQDYAHTLVIIGTVVTIIILIVRGEEGGQIAFGMFAAFSIIRFRRNMSQSRDLAFIFVSMATGLSVGALPLSQLWLAVVVLGVVALAILTLAKGDLFAPTRVSHNLRVRVTNEINYDEAFAPIFAQFTDDASLSSVESCQAGMMTELRYGITLKEEAQVSEFMEKMQLACGNNRVLLTTLKGNDLGV